MNAPWWGPVLALVILAMIIGRKMSFLNQGKYYRSRSVAQQARLRRVDPRWETYHGRDMGILEWILGIVLGGGFLVYLVARNLGLIGR